MRYSDPALIDQLAARYALGTLSGGARRRFERLRADRADVALAVAGWESRLGQLAQAVPPAQPSPRVWEAIARRTRPEPVAAAATGAAPGGWRWAGFGFGGFAAGLAVAMAFVFTAPALFLSTDQLAMRTGEKLPQSYVGLLTDAAGNGKLLVSSLRHGRTMTVKVIGPLAPVTPGRQLVLWAVPASGAPFILGGVPASGSATSQLPDTSEKLLSKVTKLLVTEETSANPGAPGTPVYSGNCAKLW
jgi:anti-sigma-K factor RskA